MPKQQNSADIYDLPIGMLVSSTAYAGELKQEMSCKDC